MSTACTSAYCPQYFFGYIGVASALIFANLGAAYGSAKAGVGICSMGVLKPELIMKSVVPVVMAGILGIYGMIVAVIIVQRSTLFSTQSLPLITLTRPHTRTLPPDSAAASARWYLLGDSGRRTGDRYCGRRRCASQRAARQDLRGNDSNPHLRRSTRPLWTHRLAHLDLTMIYMIHSIITITNSSKNKTIRLSFSSCSSCESTSRRI